MNIDTIELTTPDHLTLRGQQWLGGENYVILLHNVGEDLDCWHPLLPRLMSRGYSLIMFDLRGHGVSDGEWNLAQAEADFLAILAFVQQQNPKNIFLVTIGVSGLIVLKYATADSVKGAVLLSPTPLESDSAKALRGRGIAKLFIVGAHDEQIKQTTLQLRNESIGWSLILNLPTSENGSALLNSQWQMHIQEHITSFLHEQCQTMPHIPRNTALTLEQFLHRPNQK